MARKRARNTDTADPSPLNENVSTKAGNCPHISKGVDINTLKKSWKKKPELTCQTCKKKSHTPSKKAGTEEQDLWICMRCGFIGCSSSRNGHGLEHYRTPHSDCHAVFTIVGCWTLRCVQCQIYINLEVNGRASDAVDYVKSYFRSQKEEADQGKPQQSPEEKKEPKPGPQSFKNRPAKNSGTNRTFPVLGLENIGNTCYMNAILQCLAQTPQLVTELEQSTKCEMNFTLPGGRNLVTKEHGEDLPPLLGRLGEVGPLTKAVIKLLSRVSSGENLRKTGLNNENPADIVRLMKKLTNSFYIGEQHDSHELLRILLEGLRMEHIKRYQRGILNSLGICPSAKDVTPKERELVMAYKKQALLNEISIDRIFSGSFVSVLKCVECGSVTTNVENFMDISLPVEPEKPKTFERVVASPDGKMSKHQLKKEKKLARRGKKKGRNLRMPAEVNPEPVKSHSASDSTSDSGADVEDNVESENQSSSTKEEAMKTERSSDEVLYSTMESLDLSPTAMTTDFESSGSGREIKYDYPALSVNNGVGNYSSSPEPNKVIVVWSSDPSAVEDFGSCDGGRGSTASSIEQADWDVENYDSASGVILDIDKALGSSADDYKIQEISDISEDGNTKIADWDISFQEDPASSLSDPQVDPCFPMISPNADVVSSKTTLILNSDRKEKAEEEIIYIDEGKRKTDEMSNNLDIGKSKRHDEKYVDLAMNIKLSNDEKVNSESFLRQNNLEGDDNTWSSTLAPLPDTNDNSYSIYSSLKCFFSKEVLSGPNRVGCLHCTKMKNGQEPGFNQKLEQTDAIKQLLFLKLPSVLTVHFKRFEALHTRMNKISRKVEFPLELDVSPYTSKKAMGVLPGKSIKYHLYGVIEHTGHMTSGHYVAYIKTGQNNDGISETDEEKEIEINVANDDMRSSKSDNSDSKWYLVSDTHVKEVTLKDVLNAEAYLLFYQMSK